MIASKHLRAIAFFLTLSNLGCHAQSPAAETVSPELARRIEVLIRSKSNVPPNYSIAVSSRTKSDVPGYDQVSVTFTAEGQTSKPSIFLISTDNKTLGQFSRYDISKDPRELVSAAGRPARGGPVDAPVQIVAFDDLECPYCAKLHGQLFPALTERYKNQLRIVYRDFPLDQHPWAVRAAVDTSCLGSQSTTGYWNTVDYIHAHATDFGGPDHSLPKANDQIDNIVRDEGMKQNVKPDLLAACIAKQDLTVVNASRKEGEALGVDSTPALFINGERVEGAIPVEYIYRIIDNALIAAGQTPPPPIPVPPMPGAAKSGS
jgi:protein-disulfide isomerase